MCIGLYGVIKENILSEQSVHLKAGGKVTDGVTFALIVILQAKALPSIPVKYQENTYQRTTLTNLCQP